MCKRCQISDASLFELIFCYWECNDESIVQPTHRLWDKYHFSPLKKVFLYLKEGVLCLDCKSRFRILQLYQAERSVRKVLSV